MNHGLANIAQIVPFQNIQTEDIIQKRRKKMNRDCLVDKDRTRAKHRRHQKCLFIEGETHHELNMSWLKQTRDLRSTAFSISLVKLQLESHIRQPKQKANTQRNGAEEAVMGVEARTKAFGGCRGNAICTWSA